MQKDNLLQNILDTRNWLFRGYHFWVFILVGCFSVPQELSALGAIFDTINAAIFSQNEAAAHEIAIGHGKSVAAKMMNEVEVDKARQLDLIKQLGEKRAAQREEKNRKLQAQLFNKKMKATFKALDQFLSFKNVQIFAIMICIPAIVILFFRAFFPKLMEWLFEKSLPSIIEKRFLPEKWHQKLYRKIMNQPPPKDVSRYHQLILDKETKERYDDIVQQELQINKVAKEKNLSPEYQNIMLYGPPGTGKTMAAMAIAAETGEYWILLPGAYLKQMKPEEGIAVLRDTMDFLIELGKATGICINIIMDEADSMIPSRSGGKATPYTTDLVNLILARCPKPSQRYIRWWVITNHPNNVSGAIKSRMTDIIAVRKPDEKSCEKLLILYLKLFRKEYRNSGVNVHIDEALYNKLSALGDRLKKHGYTGRAIEAAVMKMYKEVVYGKRSDSKGMTIDEELIKKHTPDLAIENLYGDA